MPTPYEKIYSKLLPKFRSYEIPIMTEQEVKEHLSDYLSPAISKFHVCVKNLNDRDEIFGQFNEELTDIEMEIISNYMLVEYLDSTYIRTPTLLKVALPPSDFKSFSNANMLDKLLDMRDTYMKENETLLSRYSWINPKQRGKLKAGYKDN